MEVNISDRFPAMTPIVIRQTRAWEVFLLLRRMTRYNANKRKGAGKKNSNGHRKIRRPAGDNWF